MPTYEYQCTQCGHEFDKLQSMSAPVLRKCPECGKLKLKRLIGAGAGIIFKGSGFYATDYRKPNYSKKKGLPKDEQQPCSTCPESPKCPNAAKQNTK
ncbi:FmdB family zinc ribbon protein [Candidatus Omnitrophota bacterium]